MSANKILNGLVKDRKSNISVETASYIEVTKKTIRFGRNVYQFANVTGFGLAEIPRNFTIPILLLSIMVFIGAMNIIGTLFGASDGGKFLIGVIFIGIGAYLIRLILNIPKSYGFELELNSGNSRIFITKDLEGVSKVVSKLYEFMESTDDEERLIVNIDQRNASIGVGYSEHIHARNISG